MALDFPASGAALWRIYDTTGIRPEYLLASMWVESGYRPYIQNLSGAPYYGLNQISATYLGALGINPSDYVTWTASRQLSTVVEPFMKGIVHALGVPGSGIRVEQGNFYPASLKYAHALGDVIVAAPSAAYNGNKGLDYDKNGTITVQDIATFLERGIAESKGAVDSAIRQTYALRAGETPENPIYGTDFGGVGGLIASNATAAAAGIVILATAVAAAVHFAPKPRARRAYA